MKIKVAVIMGGFTDEFDVSIRSGNVVVDHLPKSKYEVYPIIIAKDSWYYNVDAGRPVQVDKNDFSITLNGKRILFDVVFNTIHGSPGEDGRFQSYLEMLGIPQTACGMYPAALTFNKRDTLTVLAKYGVQAAPSCYLNQGDEIDIAAIINAVGLPCFVKPNRSGSSIGISKVLSEAELRTAIENALNICPEVLIEKAISGMEVSVGVITYRGAVKVLPITEIIPPPQKAFFDYEAKYSGESQEITPARLSKDMEANLVKICIKIYKILNLRGFVRSEFIIDKTGQATLLEINTTPGLSEASILPQQAKAAGISPEELFSSAVEEALKAQK